jgi:tRNA threonylcarbamoyladenosine biosynthesis protein TsaB
MRSSKNILLALDTSTRTVGLALYDGAEVLSEATWTSREHHTVELAPAIAEALEKTSLAASDLAAIAVARGPGSFTGLRIGLALAKGLALARGIPLIAIPTLDYLAAAQPPQDIPLAAVLRAGRGRLATGWFQWNGNAWESTQEIDVLTLDELSQHIQLPTRVCGELSAEERLTLTHDCPGAILATPALSLRRPAFLAELAWGYWRKGRIDDPATLSPIYLHYNQPIPE